MRTNHSGRTCLVVMSWLLILMVAVAAKATAAPPNAEPMEKTMKATMLDTEKFTTGVLKHGGRVDFAFGEDAPFGECHASTVVETPSGDLLCAWFGGTKESKPDVAIWMARFSGGQWSDLHRAAKVSETAHWNPALFRDAKGVLYLFFKVGVNVPKWSTYWMRSDDSGKTWSEPAELVPGDVGGRGPVKNKPIVLANGAWLAPASTENGRWKPFADCSVDGGKTWQRSEDWAIDPAQIRGKGAIQPTFWESAPGQVHALMRTCGGRIGRTDSTDSGRTWAPVYPTDLPNNNSGIDALRLEDGRLLLVYNPVGRNWGPRTPLNLAVSRDDGKTWEDMVSLETEKGEYSYPAIVRTSKGVAISYTWKRERIRCWQIPLEALD